MPTIMKNVTIIEAIRIAEQELCALLENVRTTTTKADSDKRLAGMTRIVQLRDIQVKLEMIEKQLRYIRLRGWMQDAAKEMIEVQQFRSDRKTGVKRADYLRNIIAAVQAVGYYLHTYKYPVSEIDGTLQTLKEIKFPKIYVRSPQSQPPTINVTQRRHS